MNSSGADNERTLTWKLLKELKGTGTVTKGALHESMMFLAQIQFKVQFQFFVKVY